MFKKFIQYVIPSMLTFLVNGIYVSIDGFFVGRTVGDVGLASINVAWPLAALILAIGTGIGVGGSVIMSAHSGAGNKDKADKALGNTILLLIVSSVLLSIFLLLLDKKLLQLMGAEGEILEMGHTYIRIMAYGTIIQVLGTGITPLLRNRNKPMTAMVLSISNFVIDTICSGVFVMLLGLGVKGAAIGTVIGQLVIVIPAILILFKKENRVASKYYRLHKDNILRIIRAGLPIMGLSFIPNVTILIINRQAVNYGGTTAIASFAVISYVLCIGQLLAQGVGEGSQPLISYYFGAGDRNKVHQLRKWTYITAIGISIFAMLLVILLRNVIPEFYGASVETAKVLETALLFSSFSLPLFAFSRVTTEYLNAINESKYSSLMVYGEVLAALPAAAVVLPLLFGLNGVWAAIVVVQLIMVIAGIILMRRNKAMVLFD